MQLLVVPPHLPILFMENLWFSFHSSFEKLLVVHHSYQYSFKVLLILTFEFDWDLLVAL